MEFTLCYQTLKIPNILIGFHSIKDETKLPTLRTTCQLLVRPLSNLVPSSSSLQICQCILKTRFPETQQLHQYVQSIRSLMAQYILRYLRPLFSFDDALVDIIFPSQSSGEKKDAEPDSLSYKVHYPRGNEIDCFLLGHKQIILDMNQARSVQSPLSKIENAVLSHATEAQSLLFRLLHDVLTLRGVPSSLTDSSVNEIAKHSLVEKEQHATPDIDVKSGASGEGDRRKLEMGDVTIERDSLSGKMRVKPREIVATKDGSILIAERMTIRNTQRSVLQKEYARIGLSSVESIHIANLFASALLYLVGVLDETRNPTLCSSCTSEVEWPYKICDNFLLISLRLLSVNDVSVRINVLKVINEVIVHTPESSEPS